MQIHKKTYPLLYGKNSVGQRVIHNPSSIRKIFLQDTFKDSYLEEQIGRSGISIVRMGKERFSRLQKGKNMQGIAAEVEPFIYTAYGELLEREAASCVFLFLDRIYDPQNLGGLMRTLCCLGAFVLILPEHDACGVNETVLHVASGAENFIPVSLVKNLRSALMEAKETGRWIVGACTEGGEDIRSFSFPEAAGIVLGSEGAGLRPGMVKLLDFKVSIPMSGVQLSLNVAVAGGIFAYEITRQKKKKG